MPVPHILRTLDAMNSAAKATSHPAQCKGKNQAQAGSMVMLTVIDSSPPPWRTPLIGGQAL